MADSAFIQEWPKDKLTVSELNQLMGGLILHFDTFMASCTTEEGRQKFKSAYDKLYAASLRANDERPPALILI